jgi:predicted protein tyrosine phosphatase
MEGKDIFIYSKNEFEHKMKELKITDENVLEHFENYAFISILCPNLATEGMVEEFIENEHWFKENHDNVLNIDFFDIEQDIVDIDGLLKAITSEQANEIVEFIEKNQNKVFHIHCHAGISRSSAVAYFIRDYYEFVNKELFDRRYTGKKFPNQKVFSELKRAFERKHYKDAKIITN